jgi:hypothetical protein
MRGPLNCRSLHFGRDDKGEGGALREGWLVAERNSRSLHFASVGMTLLLPVACCV